MIFKFLLTTFLFLITQYSFSQNQINSGYAVLTGSIRTVDDTKLGNVLISISNEKNSYKVFSDARGFYKVELVNGTYKIFVSHPGYSSYEFKNFIISEKESKILDIFLIEKIVSTDEIEVEGIFKQRQDDLRTSLYNIKPQNVKILPGAV
ncbi:MAG: carboxypeptidase-like regulatory domain-containing protein, partial [Ignavibacteria bacterium]